MRIGFMTSVIRYAWVIRWSFSILTVCSVPLMSQLLKLKGEPPADDSDFDFPPIFESSERAILTHLHPDSGGDHSPMLLSAPPPSKAKTAHKRRKMMQT